MDSQMGSLEDEEDPDLEAELDPGLDPRRVGAGLPVADEETERAVQQERADAPVGAAADGERRPPGRSPSLDGEG